MKWVASLATVAALGAAPYAWSNCGSCGGDKKAEAEGKASSSCDIAAAGQCPAECAARAFKHMDANGDGKLDQAEFTAAMPKLVATIQTGGAGEAACGASAKAAGGCPKAAAKARMTTLVASFDANRNGQLSKEELSEARNVLLAVLKASSADSKSGCCPSAAKAESAKKPELKEVSVDDLTTQAMKVMDEQTGAQKAASAEEKPAEPVKVTRSE